MSNLNALKPSECLSPERQPVSLRHEEVPQAPPNLEPLELQTLKQILLLLIITALITYIVLNIFVNYYCY